MKKYNDLQLHVPGIKMSGIYSGVKKSRNDLGIIFTEKGVSAGVFTQNKIKAAPVLINQDHIKNPITKIILVNSGNANACTGELGYSNALETIDSIATKMNVLPDEVLIASTGIIGKQMEMDKILKNLDPLIDSISLNSYTEFPESITTTDTYNKVCSCEIHLEDTVVTISGVAKGSGMIHPNMATMLGFLQTDANISKKMLQLILSDVVKDTFNMISVDGDTSTNDMVLAISSQQAKHSLINNKNDSFKAISLGIKYVCKMLAISIAKDGEGATKLIECNLLNGKTQSDAKKMAKAIIQSSLVKTAIFGNDANWGRIICALGYSNCDLNPDKIDLSIQGNSFKLDLIKNGVGIYFDEVYAIKILENEKVIINVDVNMGKYNATAWGCDLTYDYIKINAEYRT